MKTHGRRNFKSAGNRETTWREWMFYREERFGTAWSLEEGEPDGSYNVFKELTRRYKQVNMSQLITIATTKIKTLRREKFSLSKICRIIVE